MITSVGGLGGSGTRVVSEILDQAGLFMGNYQNSSRDNLSFTRILKFPNWYKNASDRRIASRIRLFEKHMQGSRLSLSQRKKLVKLSMKYPHFTPDFIYKMKIWLNADAKYTLRKNWGWKEPNTYVYLEHLEAHLDDFKYIHVIRHGLDMAYSANTRQLENWGYLYDMPKTSSHSAARQFEYWIRMNRDVVKKGKELLGDRFMLVRIEDIIDYPNLWIPKITAFAGLEYKESLNTIPKEISSRNRWKEHDISLFSEEQKQSLAAFDYSFIA